MSMIESSAGQKTWGKEMLERRFGCLLCALSVIALSACQLTPELEDKSPPNFDTRNMHDTGEYLYEITTDSEAEIFFSTRMSSAAGDVNCKKATVLSQGSVSSTKAGIRHFSFSQMGSPHVALYEWHLCFEIDGVTYKAWRGFDPGPNSVLKIDCKLDKAQLYAKQTDTYLCHLKSVSVNKENFGEYALRCDANGEHCRQFETEEEASLWDSLHSDPELLEKIALAYFQYEQRESTSDARSYLSANLMPVFLSVAGSDPSELLIGELEKMGFDIYSESEWEMGKGMMLSIGSISPISGSSVSMVVSTYCGPLCASGTTVILVLDDGTWKVASMELNWIS